MQVASGALATHLSKDLRRLYTVHGDETLLQLEAADAIRQAARTQGFTEKTTFTVTGANFDWSAVRHASQSMQLFGDRQLIEIRLPGGKPGKDGGDVLQDLAQGSETVHEVLYLITLPRLDKSAQGSGWFAALQQYGVTVKIDAVERHQLPQWIAQRLRTHGLSVRADQEGEESLQFFADHVEGNLLAAHQEIEKIALLYPRGELRKSDIERAVLHVARYDVFQLSEALLGARTLRVQRMIEGLQAEGEAEVLVHWAIAEEVRHLKRVIEAMGTGKSAGAALRELRIWGPREKHLERLATRLSKATVNQLVLSAHIVDGVIKGIPHPEWPAVPWQALQRLGHVVAQACQA